MLPRAVNDPPVSIQIVSLTPPRGVNENKCIDPSVFYKKKTKNFAHRVVQTFFSSELLLASVDNIDNRYINYWQPSTSDHEFAPETEALVLNARSND